MTLFCTDLVCMSMQRCIPICLNLLKLKRFLKIKLVYKSLMVSLITSEIKQKSEGHGDPPKGKWSDTNM
jgi:hypothetical protein